MALTFCTFGRELKSAFNIRLNQTDYVNLLFAAIPVDGEKFTVNKNVAAGLMNGRRQVPNEIRFCLRDTNVDELTTYFETYVIQFIDDPKRPRTMANILDLIPEDDFIPDQDKAAMIDCESNGEIARLLAIAFTFAILAENGSLDMFVHKAPALTPWAEMPDYSAYLKRIEGAFSSIRTLLYYDNPKPFYDFYVCNSIEMRPFYSMNIRMDWARKYMFEGIANATVPTLGDLSNYLVITGTGGLGKSMMMRNLLLTSVSSFPEVGLIPVFVPLKDYNTEGIDLFEYILLERMRNRNVLMTADELFIKSFLLLYVVERKRAKTEIEFPKYQEFIMDEYSLIEYPTGQMRLVPARYAEAEQISLFDFDEEGNRMEVKREDLKITPQYEYRFPFAKIAKEKEKYPDLIQIFEGDDFQPHLDYVALYDYYKKLKAHVDAGEDGSLDFL